jgi:hypothetical protein
MLPTKELFERLRQVSLVRLPSEDGMDPEKLLLQIDKESQKAKVSDGNG